LPELLRFSRSGTPGGKPCHDVRASAERILRAMDAQIRELAAARRRLRRVVRQGDGVLAQTPASERAYSNGCRSMRTSAAADP